MTAYYNEIDPFAAQWLRELIKAGHIADGIVDERSIEDVTPNDLNGFTQCHFFAGIGVWSYALRKAGWSDDRPVWTGSCPCQPFSTAGKGAGFADERHLWPAFHWLIDQCRPDIVFGEQVAGKDGLAWLDLVCTDLENSRYTCGAAVTAACGFGAPHQRKRLYWVADSSRKRCRETWYGRGRSSERACEHGQSRGMADSDSRECGRQPNGEERQPDGCESGWIQSNCQSSASSEFCGMANSCRSGLEGRSQQSARAEQSPAERSGDVDRPGPTNGFWRDADWLGCRDGKWRPVIPSFIALVDGAAVDMVPSGAYGADDEKRKETELNHAICTQGSTGEGLPVLQQEDGEEAGERKAGGHGCIQNAEVLQSPVHGQSNEKDGVRVGEPLQSKGAPDGGKCLRNLWQQYFATCASQEQPALRQHAVELDDVMCELPSSYSLAELHGDRNTQDAVRFLHQRLVQESNVPHPLEQAPKVWASISQETKSRLKVGVDVRAWRRLVFFPLEDKATARVGRLRGYGNAICAQQAEAFIEAVMASSLTN